MVLYFHLILKLFLWFLLKNFRSNYSLQQLCTRTLSCLTSGPQPGMPVDPGFPPRFSGSTSGEGDHIAQAHTHTHTHEGMHRALSRVTNTNRFSGLLNTCREPPSSLNPCLNPGPHDCWLLQPEVCWRMTQSHHSHPSLWMTQTLAPLKLE